MRNRVLAVIGQVVKEIPMRARMIIATAAIAGFAALAAAPASAASVRTGHRVHAAEHVGLSRPAYGYLCGYPGYAFAASGPNYTCPGYGYAAARPVGFGIGFGFRPSW